MYSFKGESILDPFAGSGTTVAVANFLERKGIGYEIFEDYLEFIRKRFAYLGSPDEFTFGLEETYIENKLNNADVEKKKQLSFIDDDSNNLE